MPPSPPRVQVARVFESAAKIPFAVEYWDGSTDLFGGDEPVVRLVFRTPGGLARMLTGGLGFAEAYMDGDIDIEGDARRLFVVLNAVDPKLGLVDTARLALFHLRLAGGASLASALSNARHHYDLGNEFFQLWLDENLLYSCAYFAEPTFTLEQAQIAKMDHICKKLRLTPGDRLLDIGCGWGSLLMHAVENYGVEGVGVTLSKEQASYAKAEIERRELQGRAEVRIEDYRSIAGSFDKIVSVGMFEHVGKRAMPAYFKSVNRLLVEGGATLLHTIGRNGWLPPGQPQWIRKYIFPGGYLPEAEEIFAAAADTDLCPFDLENLKQHYALTLEEWSDRFDAAEEQIRALGFDERFVRMWRFFLYGSIEAFRTGVLQLFQVAFVKGAGEPPLTRRHLYD